MIRTIVIIFLFIFVACSTNKPDIVVPKKYDFLLYFHGPDTITKSGYDSSFYEICLLPLINNLSKDTVVFIESIYGRHDQPDDLPVYPKYGINIYKDNKKIEFNVSRGICGNWGYLDKKDFVTVYPNKLMFPFHDSHNSNPNFDFKIAVQLPVTGEVEIEAYYNTLDTFQANYHYFSEKEMKMGSELVNEEYYSCKSLFKKLPHVDLRSNRIKIFLK